MNFKNLSKEKRNQLLLVFLITGVIVAGLGFGLIKSQYHELAAVAARNNTTALKLHQMQDTLKKTEAIETELTQLKSSLATQEEDIASGDLYAWVINTLRQSKADHKIEIPQFGQLSQPTEVNLLPRFPYKQAVLTIAGTAHYHDLGRFLADFENRFPHIRLVNLTLDAAPLTATTIDDPELLSFKIDVVTLVKSNPS
jgi:Tfp pilus assembly protein PilO